MAALELGPLLRHVDRSRAAVWVETDTACRVGVVARGDGGEHRAAARTFAVHGHHYALVTLDGLPAGERLPYTVLLDDEPVWPEPGSPYPPPFIGTPAPDGPLRLLFGSCRTSVEHDAAGNAAHGVDALRAYALHQAGQGTGADVRWPDLVLFLGDQVYADETTPAMQEFIRTRRDITRPPGAEVHDYDEYAQLYRLAWSDPANRWLLSTVPTAMIFDDHDVRDDWNTSRAWKSAVEATGWWHRRLVAGLTSYWVYQHLGNLTPEERAADPVWQRIAAHTGEDEPDVGPLLDDLAARVDADPTAYRWSYARDVGRGSRLVVVDSRAARVLDPDQRTMLDPPEMAWLEQQLHGDVDHLLVATSLPVLLARGLHEVEAFDEALAQGAWGARAGRVGEWVRQAADLEHWAAFQRSYQRLSRRMVEVAAGRRGAPPATITLLSGDVHHSYVSEARLSRHGRHLGPLRSTVVQAVCSPMRNPLPRFLRVATAAASYGLAGAVGRFLSRAVRAPRSLLTWAYAAGPWYANTIAVLDLDRERLRIRWLTGVVRGGDDQHPVLEPVGEYTPGR